MRSATTRSSARSTFKVIIDPNPTANGNIIIYAALGGGQAAGVGQGGIYRSIDSGHTWQLMKAGFATDVVFDPNSGDDQRRQHRRATC